MLDSDDEKLKAIDNIGNCFMLINRAPYVLLMEVFCISIFRSIVLIITKCDILSVVVLLMQNVIIIL